MPTAAAVPKSGYNTENRQEIGGAVWVIGANGQLIVQGAIVLPTADPHIVGALWNNAGTVTVSAG